MTKSFHDGWTPEPQIEEQRPPDKPLTREEVLILKVAQLMLHRDFVDAAARSLLQGGRRASDVQDLVLRADLEELQRRCNDAQSVQWPVLP